MCSTIFRKVFPALMFAALSFASTDTFAADGSKLFKSNCARCHNVGAARLVGPGMQGVRDRWSSEANLIAWIINSQQYLKDNPGDKYAHDLFEQYNKSVMPPFTNLSEEEVVAILDYIDNPEPDKPAVADAGDDSPTAVAAPAAGASDNTLIIFMVIVSIVLLILIRTLYSISTSLVKLVNTKEGKEVEESKPFLETVEFYLKGGLEWLGSNKKVLGFGGVLITLFLLRMVWNALSGIGIYTGYEPEQPIKFSHKLHVGQNGISCEYCHNGVNESKHANIPSVNVCMNCHKGVNEGPNYGKAEIAKIYAAIGFDPNKGEYISDYKNRSVEEVQAIFKEWLEDDNFAYQAVKRQIQKPVEWIQIHKLPEHAYFNHAQHYRVAGIECQTCHGPVEEMEVVYQYSPLTMGWCIDCHRQTEVKWEENGYYAKLHDYYAKNYKKGFTMTIGNLGGLECSKCHY